MRPSGASMNSSGCLQVSEVLLVDGEELAHPAMAPDDVRPPRETAPRPPLDIRVEELEDAVDSLSPERLIAPLRHLDRVV